MEETKNTIQFSGEFGEKVKKVNDFLKKYEPHNWGKDHKSYSGYKPQWVIDAVNTEFSGDWSMDSSTEPIIYKSGRKSKTDIDIVEVAVWCSVTFNISGNRETMKAWASHPVLDDFGDAIKSAQTDAMKKAFAHFSIGNRAYHGLLK